MASGTIQTLGHEQTITTSTGWSTNKTSCFIIGQFAFVQFYVQGTPSNGKAIATGLPTPKSAPIYTAAGSSPSVVAIDSDGKLAISSAGTGTYIGGAFVYETA